MHDICPQIASDKAEEVNKCIEHGQLIDFHRKTISAEHTERETGGPLGKSKARTGASVEAGTKTAATVKAAQVAVTAVATAQTKAPESVGHTAATRAASAAESAPLA